MSYRLKYTGQKVDQILKKADNAPTINVVTQEEYDTLTQEQKNSGVYFIDNDRSNDNGGQ